MQRVAILGSTGSIGTNALNVLANFPKEFVLCAISANSNIGLLLEQVDRFSPDSVCVVDTKKAKEFKRRLKKRGIKFYEGKDGLLRMCEEISIDILVVGIVGSEALLPILKAIPKIKRLALANKEALVMAGDIIMRQAMANKVRILPVDSEHSAIFQCLEFKDNLEIRNIYITGSGGPLRCISMRKFKDIRPCQAVHHPKWKMGKKISVDSATMMNKGLEVIEAHHLFGVDIERIKVLIHPETIVHSMVEFVDGSILAQIGPCDMRMPLQYALTYPSRFPPSFKGIDPGRFKELHFYKPDFKKFPCLEFAYSAARRGGTYPCVLNASNEVAVSAFLKDKIRFTEIPKAIEKVLGMHRPIPEPRLEDIIETDRWARLKTLEFLKLSID